MPYKIHPSLESFRVLKGLRVWVGLGFAMTFVMIHLFLMTAHLWPDVWVDKWHLPCANAISRVRVSHPLHCRLRWLKGSVFIISNTHSMSRLFEEKVWNRLIFFLVHKSLLRCAFHTFLKAYGWCIAVTTTSKDTCFPSNFARFVLDRCSCYYSEMHCFYK